MDIGRMLTWTADRYPGRIAVGGPRPPRTLLASILTAGTWVPQARFEAAESLELITSNHVSAPP